MSDLFREVSKEEFDRFLADYPRPLEGSVTTICEPPNVNFNDWKRAPRWPDSVVASYSRGADRPGGEDGGWRVLKDIDSPVPDDGTRDTDKPLYDNDGVELRVGDQVDACWGWSSEPSVTQHGRTCGPDRRCVVRETITIRGKGTKYEHWSFESCHNLVRGFDMVKVK